MPFDHYVAIEPSDDSFIGSRIDFNDLPLVSFCIPTYNNEDTLDECLASIIDQEYPRFEIIIVDGGSSDSTLEIAGKYTSKIFFDEGLLGSARQTSIERSKGEILALFDSDIIIPHRRWLMNAIKFFNYNDSVGTIWPMNVAPPNSSIMTRFYFEQWRVLIENRLKEGRSVVGGGNALFLREALEDIGGIRRDIHWGEDFDWAKRLKGKDYVVIAIYDALYHDTMKSMKEFIGKQIKGSNTFARVGGFGLMEMSLKDVMYEQIVLSSLGMVRGLMEGKSCWLLFPLVLTIRAFVYSYSKIAFLMK